MATLTEEFQKAAEVDRERQAKEQQLKDASQKEELQKKEQELKAQALKEEVLKKEQELREASHKEALQKAEAAEKTSQANELATKQEREKEQQQREQAEREKTVSNRPQGGAMGPTSPKGSNESVELERQKALNSLAMGQMKEVEMMQQIHQEALRDAMKYADRMEKSDLEKSKMKQSMQKEFEEKLNDRMGVHEKQREELKQVFVEKPDFADVQKAEAVRNENEQKSMREGQQKAAADALKTTEKLGPEEAAARQAEIQKALELKFKEQQENLAREQQERMDRLDQLYNRPQR